MVETLESDTVIQRIIFFKLNDFCQSVINETSLCLQEILNLSFKALAEERKSDSGNKGNFARLTCSQWIKDDAVQIKVQS